MAMATDENYLRENGLNDTNGIVLSSKTPDKNEVDDVPDYNEAFPELTSTGQSDLNPLNPFFSSSAFNGTNSLANSTSTSYLANKIDEDRRRKIAVHEKLATTKIVSERIWLEKIISKFFHLD